MINFVKRYSSKTLAIAGSAVAATMATAGSASADIDLSGLTVDVTSYETIATFLITALVGFWGIKKGLALLGR